MKRKLNKILVESSKPIFDQNPIVENFEFRIESIYSYKEYQPIPDLLFAAFITKVNGIAKKNLCCVRIEDTLLYISLLKESLSERYEQYPQIAEAVSTLEKIKKDNQDFEDSIKKLLGYNFLYDMQDKGKKVITEFFKIFPKKDFVRLSPVEKYPGVSVEISRNGSIKYSPIKKQKL